MIKYSDFTRNYEFRKHVPSLMDFEPVNSGLAINWLSGSGTNTFSLSPVTLLCPCSIKAVTDNRQQTTCVCIQRNLYSVK